VEMRNFRKVGAKIMALQQKTDLRDGF